LQKACRHLQLACAHKGEGLAVREMRKHIGWYLSGKPGAAARRQRANAALTAAELEQVLFEK